MHALTRNVVMSLTLQSREVTKMGGGGGMFLQEYKALLWFASPLLPSNGWQTLQRKKTSVKDPASSPLFQLLCNSS